MICGYTFYQIAFYFVLYSFAGWVVEVVYHAACHGRIVNRGFLNGPVCPIYGFGVTGLLLFSGHANVDMNTMNPLLLALCGSAIATLLELVAGWLLLKFFGTRWWDYSSLPFNFHGFICLKFSLLWGLGAIILFRVFHPLLGVATVSLLPEKYGVWIVSACCVLYAADAVLTVAVMQGLNRRLKRIDTLSRSIRSMSDALTNEIGENALRTSTMIGEGRVQATLAKAELTERADTLREDITDRADTFKEDITGRADAFRENLSSRADTFKEDITDRAGSFRNAGKEMSEKLAAMQAELDSLTRFERTPLVLRRIIRAFPEFRSERYPEALRSVKDFFTGKKEGTDRE